MNRASVTKRGAILAALVCYGFWGLSFMASRTALNSASVFLLLSHRFLLAFLLMTLLRLTPLGDCRLRKKPLLPLLLLGFFEPVAYFFGEQYGILHSSTVFSGVMIGLIPLVSALAAIPVLGERITLRQFFFSLLSVGGVIGIGLMTNSGGSLDWIGVAGLLTAVVSAAAFMLLGRGIAGRYTPFERAYCMIGIGAAVFTALALIELRGDAAAYLRPVGERSYLLSLLFLGVCCSVVCFLLSNYAITGLTVAQMAVFANLTTAITVFVGAVFLHEPFSVPGLFCCAAILLGIYGVLSAPEQEKKE